MIVKRPRIKFSAGIFLLASTILTLSIYGQNFDPNSVKPSGCNEKDMNCGFLPTKKDKLSAIPEADSNFVSHRGLPSRVDLSSKMPPVGNQGRQGSCVAWTTTYALKSYQEYDERGWDYDSPYGGGSGSHVFSPAWTYNQINGGRDQGSYIEAAFELIMKKGAAPWNTMPYNEKDYRTQPDQNATQIASKFKAQSYRRVDFMRPDPIKAELAAGNPVAIGIMVYDNFYKLGNKVYDTTSGQFHGGHAILLVGYDDSKVSPNGDRGAFKLMNSWGKGWGENGFGWISYKHMAEVCKTALVLADIREQNPGKIEPTTDIKPPQRISASRNFPDRIVVTWSDVSGASAYEVERADAGSEEFASVGYANETSFTDSDISPDLAYRYRIVAVSEEKRSNPEKSPIAEGVAKSEGGGSLQQVVGLEGSSSIIKGGTAVSLYWTEVPQASGYKVQRYDENTGGWKNVGSPRQSEFTDRQVPEGVLRYRVQATAQGKEGPFSDAVEVGGGGSETPPSPITDLEASQGEHMNKIVLNWSAVPGASAYYLYRFVESASDWEEPIQVNTNSYEDSSRIAASGEQVAYVVVSANGAGISEFSEPSWGYANPNRQRAGEKLAPPYVKSKIDPAKGSVTLSWEPVKKSDEYYVMRKKKGEKEFKLVKALGKDAKTFTDSGIEKGQLYFYVVRSKPMMGQESENSNTVSGFINEKKDIKRRAIVEPGLDKFLGTWTARDWDGNAPPVNYELVIKGSGKNFEATLLKNGSQAGSYKGSIAAGSDLIETKDFKFTNHGLTGDLQVAKPEIRLAFQKKN